jgi:predicted ArsR family transcriptional regulator
LTAPPSFKLKDVSEEVSPARHAALAVASRRRLLEVLRSAPEPMDVAALASAVGLHVTTARFHLEVLERAGLVSGAADRSRRPGRPRQLYVVTAEASEATEGHRQLAWVLASVLAAETDEGSLWPERAGRLWAEGQVPVGQELSWDEGTRRVGQLFDRLGFAPRLVDDNWGRHLALDACPFRDLARDYPHVVCRVHAGLLRGALGRLGVKAAEEARLRPFVQPDLCVADLPIAGGKEEGCPASGK